MPALNRDQSKALSLATSDWRPIPKKPLWMGAVIDGLKRLGLVETRWGQTDPAHLAVAEWRLSPKERG